MQHPQNLLLFIFSLPYIKVKSGNFTPGEFSRLFQPLQQPLYIQLTSCSFKCASSVSTLIVQLEGDAINMDSAEFLQVRPLTFFFVGINQKENILPRVPEYFPGSTSLLVEVLYDSHAVENLLSVLWDSRCPVSQLKVQKGVLSAMCRFCKCHYQ